MSQQEELEKLHSKRVELEAASRLLKEEQDELEKSVLGLEEKIIFEEMKKEKTVIADLRKRNKAVKGTIAQLEAKKKELETKLHQTSPSPETSPPEDEKTDAVEEALEPVEVIPEEYNEGFTVTAIVDEALIQDQEVASENHSKREKKKRRFF